MIQTRLCSSDEQEKCGLRFRISSNIDEGVDISSVALLVHGRAGTLDSKLVFGRPYVAAGAAVILPEALSHMSVLDPDLFSSVALLCGFVPRHILTNESLVDGKSLPDYFIFHGAKDQIVPIEKAELARDYLARASKLSFSTDDVGHKVSSSGMKELAAWLEQRL